MLRAENLSADLLRKRRHSDADTDEDDGATMIRPMTSVAASRKLVEERGLQLSDDDGDQSDGTDYDEHDIYAVKKTEDFKAVKGQPGMFYKVRSYSMNVLHLRLIRIMCNYLDYSVEKKTMCGII